MPRNDRNYHSPTRTRQAGETRGRIIQAARSLLASEGYAGTTIDAIARSAGVAPQTVYAGFRSKRGVLAAIVDGATFGPRYNEIVRQARAETDPRRRIEWVARIARQVHDSTRRELDLLRGAGVVAPELAALEHERERRRFDAQMATAECLVRSGQIRKGVSDAAVRETLWALTCRELYRLLVVERRWSSEQYEEWLADLLERALLERATRQSGSEDTASGPHAVRKKPRRRKI